MVRLWWVASVKQIFPKVTSILYIENFVAKFFLLAIEMKSNFAE